MSDTTGTIRLSKAAKEIGVGIGTIVEHLGKKGQKIESNPNTKITDEQYQLLLNDFQSDKKTKDDAQMMGKQKAAKKEEIVTPVPVEKVKAPVIEEDEDDDGILIKSGLVPEKKHEIHAPKKEEIPVPPPVLADVPVTPPADDKPKLKVMGKINLADLEPKSKEKKSKKTEVAPEAEVKPEKKVTKKEEVVTPPVAEVPVVEAPPVIPVPPVEPEETQMKEPNYEKLSGLKVMGRIELPVEQPPKKPTPVASSDDSALKKKRRRKTNFVAGSDNVDQKKF